MSCPHRAGCVLYPLFTLQASLKTWQIQYCDGEYAECSRYQFARDGRSVPSRMLPNGKVLPSLKPKE